MAIPLAIGCLGLIVSVYPMISSRLHRTHGGLGDARLVNYLLEHGYRWVMQYPGHENFWDAPVYYPYPNVSAFTEVMLGVGPFYWTWRWLGFAADTSFQLWLLTVWALNFAASYWMLRCCLQAGALSTSCGAYLISFASVLQVQFGHPQMLPLFYVALAVAALCRIFAATDGPTGPRRRRLWIAVFFTCVALQAYSCLYTFFFFGLFCGLVLLGSLAIRESRKRILAVAVKHWPVVSLCLVLTVCLLAVLGQRYLITAAEIGVRPYRVRLIPRWYSWLLVPPGNYLYGWVYSLPSISAPNPNHAIGLGFVTAAFSLIGLWHHRRSAWIRVLLWASAGLIVLATVVGDVSLWKLVYACVPGGKAVRAVGRIGIVMLLPAAVGLTLYFERLRSRGRTALLALVVLVCFAEQLHRHRWIEKQVLRDHVEAIAARVDPDSQAFFLVRTAPEDYRFVADDAIWVELASGVPTINGRHGNFPPNWGLREAQDNPVRTNADRAQVRAALRAWVEANHLDAARVQLIEYRGLPVPQHQKTPQKPPRRRRRGQGSRRPRNG
jgi:hypothetical protein